jgi:hypothetical protein
MPYAHDYTVNTSSLPRCLTPVSWLSSELAGAPLALLGLKGLHRRDGPARVILLVSGVGLEVARGERAIGRLAGFGGLAVVGDVIDAVRRTVAQGVARTWNRRSY